MTPISLLTRQDKVSDRRTSRTIVNGLLPARLRKAARLMARTEARIFTAIWKDPEFLSLSATAQRLFMFLLSQDDLTYCGVMPLRPPRWVPKAAGLTLGELEQDLKALESANRMFAVTDHDSGELMVRSLMRHDGIWKQPNLMKLARESAAQVESPRIRGVMLAELRRLPLSETGSDLVRTLVADFAADLEMGGPYPTPYPSGYPSEIGTEKASDDPEPDPSGEASADPAAQDNARAQGFGERYIPTLFPGPHPPVTPKPSLPAQSRKNATRLPDDFAVTDDMRGWARRIAPHVDADREFERFRDYWLAKPGRDGRKLDWPATWRNWMRNAEDRQGPRERPGGDGRPRSTTDERMANAQALKARLTPARPQLEGA